MVLTEFGSGRLCVQWASAACRLRVPVGEPEVHSAIPVIKGDLGYCTIHPDKDLVARVSSRTGLVIGCRP